MFEAQGEKYGCPVEALASILGKKWVPNIIWSLKDEQKRFGELQRQVEGCTKKMLIQQLELLMGEGIVENKKSMENNSIESIYYLSETGMTLLPIVEQMIRWGNLYLTCGEK